MSDHIAVIIGAVGSAIGGGAAAIAAIFYLLGERRTRRTEEGLEKLRKDCYHLLAGFTEVNNRASIRHEELLKGLFSRTYLEGYKMLWPEEYAQEMGQAMKAYADKLEE